MKRVLTLALVGALGLSVFASTAFAATALFGGATLHDGSVTLVSNTSDTSTDNDYSGIDIEIPEGLTLADLTNLGADVNVMDDFCAGGSPRFQIQVETDDGLKNIFAYVGEEPNYTNCTTNEWHETMNLLTENRAIDTSQLSGGTFYDTLEHALAAYGDYEVVSLRFVVDAGWADTDGEQTVMVDNIRVNDEVHTFTEVTPSTPTTKEKCKDGGWRDFGTTFKNQGQCVSSVAKQR